jgi:hypothetical protein
MPLTNTEKLSVISQQANGAVALLAQIAARGATTPRSLVEAWQRSWNSRKALVEQVAREMNQTAIADAVRARTLVVDGYWGLNTAWTTTIWLTAVQPPPRLYQVRTWWQVNSTAIGAERDRIAAAYAREMATPTAAPSPPPPVVPPPPPAPEPAPPPPPPAGQPYDTTTERTAPMPTSGGADPSSVSNGGSYHPPGAGGSGALLGVLALAIGGYLVYSSTRGSARSTALRGPSIEEMKRRHPGLTDDDFDTPATRAKIRAEAAREFWSEGEFRKKARKRAARTKPAPRSTTTPRDDAWRYDRSIP